MMTVAEFALQLGHHALVDASPSPTCVFTIEAYSVITKGPSFLLKIAHATKHQPIPRNSPRNQLHDHTF